MKKYQELVVLFTAVTMLYGCVLAWMGVGAGVGIGTYKYIEGRVVGQYPVAYARAWDAVNSALANLKISVSQSSDEGTRGKIEAVRKDGKEVSISLQDEGLSVTTISVRVGKLGDKSAAEKIHDQIVAVLGL